VAGYGNTLRRDDGAGCRVAEVIAIRWEGRAAIRRGPQLVPEWAADIAESDVAFLVDASAVKRGRLRLRRLTATSRELLLDGHAIGPEQLLQLVETVYGSAPLTYLLEVPATDFELGSRLSPMATNGVKRAIRLLDRRLSRLLQR